MEDKIKITKFNENVYIIQEDFVRFYAIEDGGECLLIDTGFGTLPKERLDAEGVPEPQRIIFTHNHGDHMGDLYRWPACTFLMHEVSIPSFNKEHPQLKAEAVTGGDTITVGKYTFEIYHIPGHAHGHICLYEPTEKWIFTGDTIGENTPIFMQGPEGDIDAYLKSLDFLKSMGDKISVTFTCHGIFNPELTIFEDLEKLMHGIQDGTIVPEPKTDDMPGKKYSYGRAAAYYK